MPGYCPASSCCLSPSPLGPPAISTKVGSQSSAANSWFFTVPGRITPGQRMTIGARYPPSQASPFWPLNGVIPPSGKLICSATLSVVNTTMVLLVWPISSIFCRTRPILSSICFMPASLTHQSLPPRSPTIASYFGDNTVTTCMRAGLYQTKNGLLVRRGSCGPGSRSPWRRFPRPPSSSVPVSAGPRRCSAGSPPFRQRTCRTGHCAVASDRSWSWIHSAGDLRNARDRRIAAWRRDGLLGGTLVDVGEAHLLHRVEVIEIAPVFLEAVRRRQRVGVISQVVLAELAGVVAEIEQELGDRRRAGPQIGGASRQLRRDHAGAHRIHAGEEGIAPGGAALHGDVVHEDRTLVPDAVDVRRLADHQAAVVDARLHPADVVAHDEEDVGLLLLRGRRRARHHDRHERSQQTEPDISGHTH